MSRQLHLFELLKALTKAEKRYFKLHASRNVTGEKNSYVQLFDLLDSMKTFDKAKLDKALTADLSISNLSVANEYLFNAILESLELFNRGHSIDQQLAGQLAQAAILRDKGLYAPSFLLLIKAERLAQRHERFTALVDIYGLMRTLMATNRFSETGSHDLPSVLNGALTAARETQLLWEVREIQYHFQRTLSLKGIVNREAQLTDLQALTRLPVLAQVTPNSAFHTQIIAMTIRSQYHVLAQELEESYVYSKGIYELCLARPEVAGDGGRLLFAAANNYMMRCDQLQRYDEIRTTIGLLATIEPVRTDVMTIKVETMCNFRMALALFDCDFSDASLVPSIEAELARFEGKLNPAFVMLLCTSISIYFFLQGRYHDALQWINRFLYSPDRSSLNKNIPAAELYRLLIFFEMGQFELLDSQNESVKNLLRKREDYPKLRATLHTFFRKGLKDNGTMKEKLDLLQGELRALFLSKEEYNAFDLFRFDIWALAKQTNRPMHQLLRSKEQ